MRYTTDTWRSAGLSLAKNIFGLVARWTEEAGDNEVERQVRTVRRVPQWGTSVLRISRI